jgi:hypothetical protein
MLGPVAKDLQRVIVDGANVVGSRPDGWWADRAGAARRLAEQLRPLVDGGREVVLVLEGKARPGVAEASGPFAVVHAPADGDTTIVEVLRAQADPAQWTVVTADRALAGHVQALGARVVGPGTLWRALDQ